MLGLAVAGGAAGCEDLGTSEVRPPTITDSTGASESSSPAGGPVPLPPGVGSTPTMGPLDRPFGPACSRLPATGAGSPTALARQRVGAALQDLPLASQAVALVQTADGIDTLNGQTSITVFVPDDEAFARLDAEDRERLSEPRRATDVLRYHVVARRLAPDQLVGGHRTLDGQLLGVEGSGQDFTVDGRAHVVCGNIQTANATVYVIDAVLQPPS